MKVRFAEAVAASTFLLATVVLAYIAVVLRDATATGALIAIVAAGNSFFLRAKVQPPTP